MAGKLRFKRAPILNPPPSSGPLIAPLALFHRPPTATHATGTLLMGAASTPSIVVFSNGDEPYLTAMRAAGYTGDALQYVLSNQMYGPNGTGSASLASNATRSGGFLVYDNQFGYQNADYGAMADASLVHNGNGISPYAGQRVGSRIYKIHGDSYQGDQYDHEMKPDGAAWMTLRNTRGAGWANTTSRPYAGFFLDNVDYEYAPNRFDPSQTSTGTWNRTISEYPNVPYTSQAAWRTAIETGMANLRTNLVASKRPTYPWDARIWGNMTTPEPPSVDDEWSALRSNMDGIMLESLAANWSPQYQFGGWRSEAETERQMANITAWLNAGKKVIVVVQGNHSADPDPNQQFALCLFYMVYQAGAYFRWSPDSSEIAANVYGSGGYLSWRHYANYLIDVGQPLAAATRVGTVWTRQFTNKTVTADFATHVGTIA